MRIPKEYSTLEWRDIEGYEGKYVVSESGQIASLKYRNSDKFKLLKQAPNSRGYLAVCLYKDGKKKTKPVHRLTATAFKDNPDNKPQVHHIDHNILNNHKVNLMWVTGQENIDYAVKNGSFDSVGAKNGRALLSKQDIIDIREEYSNGVFQRKLAKKYGVSRPHISDIVNFKKWAHI